MKIFEKIRKFFQGKTDKKWNDSWEANIIGKPISEEVAKDMFDKRGVTSRSAQAEFDKNVAPHLHKSKE